MAGIEQLEVHSKSYIVRWVQVDGGDTLSWSVQPHKKSINFGIVKHPGSGATNLISAPGTSEPDSAQLSEARGASRFPKKDSSAQELLANKGFIPIKWIGKCEADKVSIGQHDVPAGQSGMYGLVFDNTFSKQTSKTATFVVLTYPTGAPPHGANHLPNLQSPNARGSQSSLGKYAGGRLDGVASTSSDSLHSHPAGGRTNSVSGRSDGGGVNNYHVGTLSKRRRKKGQGYARRYFSLDYSTCTLSYYYNRNSSALRGAIPLSLAAVAADERRREISIDSGAEVWHLRAPNDREFQEWARALEKASRVARGLETIQQAGKANLKVDTRHLKTPYQSNHDEDAEWQQIETLVSRVVGTRDALRRLTKEVAVPKSSSGASSSGQFLSPASAGAMEEKSDSYFAPVPERKPFWKRKSSANVLTPSMLHQSSTPTSPTPETGNSAFVPQHAKKRSRGGNQEERSLHDHCQSLLTDLDSVVAEFTSLISTSRRRRMPMPGSAGGVSRKSIETTASSIDEFFDAEDATSRVVRINGSEDESDHSDEDEGSFPDSSSVSSLGEDESVSPDDIATLYPAKPKSLTPLPLDEDVERRSAISPSAGPPPSLIALVRKNVGKDLSTISMPVSTNEPTSMLQKVAEQMEYAQLLDKAVQQKTSVDRLLYVTAFAVSQFSSSRAKERAVRKPFTPLLGETFELVRTSKEVPGGFRLLVEKVQHRPIKLAMQADSANWSFSQCASPGQKFWGKSAEITTDGRVRVALRLPDGSDELYSWNIATMFLRNVVMGEKYVEPVGSMHVSNDSTGHRATAEFKQKGMFGARTEDVQVDTFNADGSDAGGHLTGNWTGSLRMGSNPKNAGEEVWRAGRLADNASQAYGLTAFAASLNEITAIEKGKMAPTDCRLRPDQRMAEEGDLDGAEDWKTKLEEAQRARRREMEEKGEEHRPRWFVRAEHAPEGEDVWKIKGGKESYWEERAKGKWDGCLPLFAE